MSETKDKQEEKPVSKLESALIECIISELYELTPEQLNTVKTVCEVLKSKQ